MKVLNSEILDFETLSVTHQYIDMLMDFKVETAYF